MKPAALVVEDNETNGYLVQFLLEREGFSVMVALNGEQALEFALQSRPHLVVMDIQMPEMDGYETAARFKGDPCLAGIPLVGVSSFAMLGDRARALAAGFSGYIEKPIDPSTFVREIKTFLR